MSTQNKNCPCCKGIAVTQEWLQGVSIEYYYVECVDCGLKTPSFKSPKLAENLWNKRV